MKLNRALIEDNSNMSFRAYCTDCQELVYAEHTSVVKMGQDMAKLKGHCPDCHGPVFRFVADKDKEEVENDTLSE